MVRTCVLNVYEAKVIKVAFVLSFILRTVFYTAQKIILA